MGIEKIYLDPNAVVYTDDQIVGKVNTATAKISRADSVEVAAILESATEKLMSDTEKTKLGGIEIGATADQTGIEVRDLVVALDNDDRKIIISRPLAGQKKIYAIQTHTDGKQEVEQNDTPEPE